MVRWEAGRPDGPLWSSAPIVLQDEHTIHYSPRLAYRKLCGSGCRRVAPDQRLEEEQEEFHTFLEKLRQARDKPEFDQFMADRARKADVTDVGRSDDDKPAA